MKCRYLTKVCVALVLLFAITACSSKKLNVEIVKDLIVEYGDELDNSKLYDAEKSDNGLKIEKVENFDTKKVGKQEIKVFFSNGDKKVEKLITVEVKDTKKPSIELNEESIIISKGEEFDYISLIKKVSDPVDGELKLGKENEKNSYWLGTSKLDINIVGDYEVYINALDINGLKADTVKLQVTVKEDKEISSNGNDNNQTYNNGSNTNSGKSSSSGNGSSSSNGSSNTSKPSNNGSSSTTEPSKGPKPAYGTVIQANDFPSDGWHWYRNTYCWIPATSSWGEAPARELEEITWQISPNTNSPSVGQIIDAIPNARMFMPPAPTFEQSKQLVTFENHEYIKYGETTLYVYIED